MQKTLFEAGVRPTGGEAPAGSARTPAGGGAAGAGPAGERAQAEAERLTRALREACERRLRHEWHVINYAYLRERLRPPVIEVCAYTGRWGAWCRQTRTITIAERLVTGYRWESVFETLKHEVAHQVVDELFKVEDAPHHGEAFRRACDLLAIDAAASGPGGIPLQGLATGESGAAGAAGAGGAADRGEAEHDGRLRKIRRLLALADSPNVHEAEAALAKANELLLKYNIDLVDAEHERSYVVRQVGEAWRRRPKHVKILAGLLGEHFFVESIWTDTYDVRAADARKILEVMGTAENVDLAEHAFHELLRSADELWIKHSRAERTPRRYRRQYVEGVIMGYGARLDRERKSLAEDRALVWTGDPGLEAFFRRRYPRVGHERVSVGVTDAYAAGREAGEALTLTRALREHQGDRGRLLGHGGGG